MSTSASASIMSSTAVSLAISSACSSNSSLAGSSAFALPSFLLFAGLSLFAGALSSSTGSLTSAPSDVTVTSSAKIRSMISSRVPVHLTPSCAANFLKSLYFIALSCSTSNLPVTASALPSVSTGGFIGSSACAFFPTVLLLGASAVAVSSAPPASALLIVSRPAIVMSIPLIISALLFI